MAATETTILYADNHVLTGRELEKIYQSLLFLVDAVFINVSASPSTALHAEAQQQVLTRWGELAEEGLIRFWSFPHQPAFVEIAAAPPLVLEVPRYLELYEAVQNGLTRYRKKLPGRVGSRDFEGITELVEVSGSLWMAAVSAWLQVDRILTQSRELTLLNERGAKLGYETAVVQEFLKLQGIPSGVASLGVHDLVKLRRRFQSVRDFFRESMGQDATPLVDESLITRRAHQLMNECVETMEDSIRSSRRGFGRDLAVDGLVEIASNFVPPLAGWPTMRALWKRWKANHRSRLALFVIELKDKLARSKHS